MTYEYEQEYILCLLNPQPIFEKLYSFSRTQSILTKPQENLKFSVGYNFNVTTHIYMESNFKPQTLFRYILVENK